MKRRASLQGSPQTDVSELHGHYARVAGVRSMRLASCSESVWLHDAPVLSLCGSGARMKIR